MTDLPKTFKACVYDEPGKISTKIVDLDMPEPGPGEVLINLLVKQTTPSPTKHVNSTRIRVKLTLDKTTAPTPASATPT